MMSYSDVLYMILWKQFDTIQRSEGVGDGKTFICSKVCLTVIFEQNLKLIRTPVQNQNVTDAF